MEKSVDLFAHSLLGIHSGALNPGVIDTVRVEYLGQKVPISRIANSERLNKNAICVDPLDPSMVGPIANCLKANGFNAYAFSKTRVVISTPPVCGEEREKVKKHIRKLGEETKVAIRNIRKNYRKNNPDCNDKDVQKITDTYVKEVDRVIDDKLTTL